MSKVSIVIKTALLTLGVLYALVPVAYIGSLVFPFAARLSGQEWLAGLSGWWLSGLVFALVIWLKPALSIKVEKKARVIIDAPLETVWAAVRPREMSRHFASYVNRIEAVPGQPDRFDYLFEQQAQELMSTDVDRLEVLVTEVKPGRLVRERLLNASDLPSPSCYLGSTEMALDSDGAATVATYRIFIEKMTLDLAGFLLFVNPAKEVTSELKAFCEGYDPDSLTADLIYEEDPDAAGPTAVRNNVVLGLATTAFVTVCFASLMIFVGSV